MPVGYLIDTDIASYSIKGSSSSVRVKLRYTAPSQLFLSAVTAAELLYGIKHFPIDSIPRRSVKSFLASAQVLPWDLEAAQAYADIRYSLALGNNPIGELDMMIAAQALAENLTLVTNNIRHFQRLVPPLQMENWAEA